MEEKRINWNWLQTTKHKKRTQGYHNLGHTNKKQTRVWEDAKNKLINFLNKQPCGVISLNVVSKNTDVSIEYVYNLMFDIEKNNEVKDLNFRRTACGRRVYYKGEIMKNNKSDIRFVSGYKPKIDHRIKAQVKEQMEKKTQPKAL